MSDTIAVLGPGRIGRQIALTFALGGFRVLLVDREERGGAGRGVGRGGGGGGMAGEWARVAEEGVMAEGGVTPAGGRREEGVGLGDLAACTFVQEALPESVDLKRAAFKRL